MEERKLGSPRNFKEQVEQMLEKLIVRAEREVPEYGDFAPVTELFQNLDPGSQDIVGKFGLTILKLPKDVTPDPKERYVEACAYEPTGSYKAKMFVAGGYKDEILLRLKEGEFIDSLCHSYAVLKDSLKD
jgi:hypothetical protein